MKPVSREQLGSVIAIVLVLVAVWRLADTAWPFRLDDPYGYFKTSELMRGRPAPTDAHERWIYDFFSPANYVEHPGTNVPYRDFQEEYPPLALVFFFAPSLVTSGFLEYARAFALEMSLLHILLGLLLWRFGVTWRQSAICWALFTIYASRLIVCRFDVAPALFAAGGLYCFLAGRSGWAGGLLGLGAATKLWPGLLVPALLVATMAQRDLRSAIRLSVASAMGFIGPHVPFMLLCGWKAFSYLQYHGARGLQVESTWANLAILAGHVLPLTVYVGREFGASHIGSPDAWLPVLLRVTYVAMAAGYVLVLVALRRRLSAAGSDLRQAVTAASAAVILVFMTTGKVLSPQFLIWMFPIVFVPDAWLRWGVVLVTAMTGAYFPLLYDEWVITMSWPGTLIVFVRNALLCGMLVRAVHVLRTGAPMATTGGEVGPQDPVEGVTPA